MEVYESCANKLLCIACLCAGRNLRNITNGKCRDFYLKALNELPLFSLSSINLAICFECEALLRKAVAFKEQVQDSYRILQTYTTESLVEFLFTDVTRPPRLKVHYLDSVDVPPNINEIHIKNEVKSEDGRVKIDKHSDAENDSDGSDNNLKCENQDSDTHSLIELSHKKKTLKKKWKTKSKRVLGSDKKKVKRPSKKIANGSPKILEVNINEIGNDNSNIDQNDWCNSSESEKIPKDLKIKNEKRLKREKEDCHKKSKADSRIITIHVSYEEIMKERDVDAERDSYIRAEFKCDTCVMSFDSNNCLMTHNETKHNLCLGGYTCTICQCVLSTQELLNSHHRRHTKRYECTVCGNRSIDLTTARKHLKTTHIKQYTCRFCKQTNNSLDRHRYHMECHKSRVQCPECDKTFSHRAGLMNHRLVVHECKNNFPCTLCDKVFQWKNSLKRHLEKHNAKNKSEETGAFCSPCGIAFAYVCSYKRHLRNSLKHVTHEQLKYICDHCKRRFADKTKLRDHIEEKHLHRTYQCNICKKPTKNRAHLEQHVRNVHIGRPNNKMCHHCGKGFPTKVQLECHIRTHTGERPFICELCPTTFTQQSNLYKHNRQVHQNIKTKRYPPHKKRKPDEIYTEPSNHQAIGDYRLDAHNVDNRFVLT